MLTGRKNRVSKRRVPKSKRGVAKSKRRVAKSKSRVPKSVRRVAKSKRRVNNSRNRTKSRKHRLAGSPTNNNLKMLELGNMWIETYVPPEKRPEEQYIDDLAFKIGELISNEDEFEDLRKELENAIQLKRRDGEDAVSLKGKAEAGPVILRIVHKLIDKEIEKKEIEKLDEQRKKAYRNFLSKYIYLQPGFLE